MRFRQSYRGGSSLLPMNGRKQQQIPFGDDNQKSKSKTTADPPFDFAQGRLFGDDNKNGES